MKPNELYARLELISPEVKVPETGRNTHWMNFWKRVHGQLDQVGHRLLNYFCGSMDPRISVRQSRNGIAQFRVYDPVTQRRLMFRSEAELRVWLDQRY
jgi:hypothetical protein